MASLPRYLIIHDDCYFHLTWQCHNKEFFFKDDYYKKYYYDLLIKHKEKYHIKIYAYCFMSSHIHLAGHCETKEGLSNFVRVVNSSFARCYNRRNNRRGQVCMDRFKSSLIENDKSMMNVINYIELNPLRAHIVQHPSEYSYSSFSHYAYGKDDPLITDVSSYLSLGSTNKERQDRYLEMINEILKDESRTYKKENYSTTLFIGNSTWVLKKHNDFKKLKEINNNNFNNNLFIKPESGRLSENKNSS